VASLIVTYWRDIPAHVSVEKGRGRRRESAKVELAPRFAAAIDAAAMKGGADGTDAYLAEWRRSEPVDVPDDDMSATAASKAAAIEADWTGERLRAAIAAGGWETG
jgi:hypothetical protein